MIEVELARILIAETRDGQIIVLKEKDGSRAFPIVIGYFEAAAIDRHVKEIPTPRPLTHDLLSSVIKAFGGKLDHIVINDLRDNTFFARLIIKVGGETLDVDSRPSDAIALAVQSGCPVFVEEHVLNEVATTLPAGDFGIIPEIQAESEAGGVDEADEEEDKGEEGEEEDDEPWKK
jgi:hypothetical protein